LFFNQKANGLISSGGGDERTSFQGGGRPDSQLPCFTFSI